MFIHRQPVGEEASKLAEVLGFKRNCEIAIQRLGHMLRLIRERVENIQTDILVLYEKAIATCEERNFTSSSDPSILTPILDAIYNKHHGG
ncbi:hypothetical protein Taro_056327 [Colocasia esculenta]|uniref:Uncharacterized protein n=1 Tax=Colocasia esculenta TaxID=4460 RepID=A0A843XTM0_COLES|nr:hypothetical protein [Colocasia esculenta]